jgi:nucleoside-triphosphatase
LGECEVIAAGLAVLIRYGYSQYESKIIPEGENRVSAFFVTGGVGVGKSTLLNRVIDALEPKQKIYGFRTKKIPLGSDYSGAGEIYIYPAMGQLVRDDAHCVGEVLAPKGLSTHSEVFEGVGVELLTGIPQGSIVLMDELGFLESSAPKFCDKVLELINGDYLILGAIKPRELPLLNAVREHPKTRLFEITEQNRSLAADAVIKAFKAELAAKQPNTGA